MSGGGDSSSQPGAGPLASAAMTASLPLTVLHYLGADDDRGGIVTVVRAMAATGEFACVLGVNPGFEAHRPAPRLTTLELSPLEGETLNLRTLWRARRVAQQVQAWLNAAPGRVFHGHSRAGLAVALWLQRRGETRVFVTVHAYGRRRWFYRWAARQLGPRLFWLTPAMKRYYEIGDGSTWEQCLPGGLPAAVLARAGATRDRSRRPVRIGGAGLLVRWKGWHLILDALAHLPPEVRGQLRFIHIGSAAESAESDRYAAELLARTVALGLEDLVEWRGERASSDGLLQEVDCVAVLSEREPFSMIMLEALAAGVPVIASAAGGPADVIAPGMNGWLFPPGDVTTLVRILTELVTSDALQRVRIEPAQLERFQAERVAREWARIYSAT
jgi:glycosyltransferase involved in cell wall biosynthesis